MIEKEEKTEPATKKRLKEAYEKGDVATSSDFSGAFILLGGIGFVLFFPSWSSYFYTLFKVSLFSDNVEIALIHCIKIIFFPLISILVFLFVIAFLAQFLQVGWSWNLKRITSMLFQKKSNTNITSIFLKLLFLICFIFLFYLFSPSPQELFFKQQKKNYFFSHLRIFILILLFGCLLLGIVDYLLVRIKRYKRLSMTRKEVEDEMREDGDLKREKKNYRK